VAYANGSGVPKDYAIAYAWLNVAAASGFEIALGNAMKIGETNVLTVRVRDRANYGGIWKSVKLVGEKRD